MVKITSQNITDDEVLRLLKVFAIHKEILEKVNLSELNFFKRKALQVHIKEVNDLYTQLDNKK